MHGNERQVARRVAARDAAGARVVAVTAAVAAMGVVGGSVLGVHLAGEASATPATSTTGVTADDDSGQQGRDDGVLGGSSDDSVTRQTVPGSPGLAVPGPGSSRPHATSGGS